MSLKMSSIASVMSLLMVSLPLSGCAAGDLMAALKEGLRAPAKGTVVICPPELPNPPDSVLVALDGVRKIDPLADKWTVDLEKHYEAQDAARPKCAARHG